MSNEEREMLEVQPEENSEFRDEAAALERDIAELEKKIALKKLKKRKLELQRQLLEVEEENIDLEEEVVASGSRGKKMKLSKGSRKRLKSKWDGLVSDDEEDDEIKVKNGQMPQFDLVASIEKSRKKKKTLHKVELKTGLKLLIQKAPVIAGTVIID